MAKNVVCRNNWKRKEFFILEEITFSSKNRTTRGWRRNLSPLRSSTMVFTASSFLLARQEKNSILGPWQAQGIRKLTKTNNGKHTGEFKINNPVEFAIMKKAKDVHLYLNVWV